MKMRSLVVKEEGIRASSKEVTDFRGKRKWWWGSGIGRMWSMVVWKGLQ